MANTKTFYTTPGTITVSAYDIDDQVNIWIGTNKVWGDGTHPITRNVPVASGQEIQIRFEVYNMTGGRFHADFAISSAGGILYNQSPDGTTVPGSNIVFSETVVVVGK